MAASATAAGKVNLQKRLYDENPSDPMFKESKLMNMIKHDTGFYGEGKYLVVSVNPTAGVAWDFNAALAAQNPSDEVRFFVEHKQMFAVWSIQNDAIMKMENDKGAIVRLAADEQKKTNYAWGQRMPMHAFGLEGGTIGQLTNTTTSTLVIKLASRVQVRNVHRGDWLEFANDNGTAASPLGLLPSSSSPVYAQVASINRQTNSITVTLSSGGATLATITGLTTATYVFHRGSYNKGPSGLFAWAPIADPTASESFHGIDRTAKDIQFTSGVRPSLTGKTKMNEVLNKATAEALLQNAGDDGVLITNPMDISRYGDEIDIQKMYTNQTGPTGVSFQVGIINTLIGSLKVVLEPKYPQGYFHIGNAKDFGLHTAGECPRPLTVSGAKYLDSYTSNARQGRMGCLGNFWTENPGHWVIGTWPHGQIND